MRLRLRSRRGNVLVLIMVVIAFIVVPVLIVQSQLGLYFVDRDRANSVVEAACLVAASDLSRIVVLDPHFGYVSLSNYAPVGRATLARDGEPLPVMGINTLTGTIRQNTIVAGALENATMMSLVDRDRLFLYMTVKRLNRALAAAAAGGGEATDMDGEKIEPLKHVTEYLKAHLPANLRLKSVNLECGWLKDDGTTTIAIPEPEHTPPYARVRPEKSQGGMYKPFVNVPVGKKAFYFAGLSSSSRIVTASRFRKADQRRVSSIVRLVCTVTRADAPKGGLGLSPDLRYVVCCQPYSMEDSGPRGVMTLRFTGGPVWGMQSWRDLLKDGTFCDRRVTIYKAFDGDYPVDREARMRRCQPKVPATTSNQLAEHLYCFLRNGNLRPKLGSVMAMIDETFSWGGSQFCLYEFGKDGKISRRTMERSPFTPGLAPESQLVVVSDTSITGGLSPVIIITDNVRFLGTEYGGKHGGQPLAGTPLNWCEIREYGGDEHFASGLGKGHLGTRLTLSDPGGSAFNLFRGFNGGNLTAQPRKSYYSGGLAVDIEIGGTAGARDPARDMLSMRRVGR